MEQKILVVDDEREIADLLEVYLANEGYAVFKFYRGEEALACVDREDISLALLDVMLPDMDGFALCQRIREEHLFPIIMLTAKVEDMDKIMGLTLGADDYITSCGATRGTILARRPGNPGSGTTSGGFPSAGTTTSVPSTAGRSPSRRWSSTSCGTCVSGRGASSPPRSCLRRCGRSGSWTATTR